MRFRLEREICFDNRYRILALKEDVEVLDFWDDVVIYKEYKDLNLDLTQINQIINDLHHGRHKLDYKSEEYKEIKSLEDKIFNLHIKAIETLGFTPKQASVISYQAYEDGHSAGYSEVISYCISYCEFAKQILEGNK